MRTLVLALVLGVVAAGVFPNLVRSQDPVPTYPENYKVLFENDRVRVLDFRLAKGAREQFHTHPANVAVFLEEFTIRFTFPDGTTAIREGQPGVVGYSDAVTHASENIGTTDAHGILVELKAPPAVSK